MAWRCTETPCSLPRRKNCRPSDTDWNSYATTSGAAFTPKIGTKTTSLRPQTIRLDHSFSLVPNETHYNEEYFWKARSKEDWIKTGPYRPIKNQISPLEQDFIRWSPPRGDTWLKDNCSYKFDTMGRIKKAIANQFVSHARSNFMDKSEVMNINQLYQNCLNWKDLVPRPADTEFRRSYQPPPNVPEFRDFSFKYGCYARLPVPSQGTVPSVLYSHLRTQELIKRQTIYQSDYGEACLDFLTLLNTFTPSQVQAYLQSVSSRDRKILDRFIRAHCDIGEKVK